MRRLAVSALLFAALLSPACARAEDWSLRLAEGYSAAAKDIREAGLGAWAIEPGTGLSPEFSDPARVRTILKLIEDVYYGRPLQYPKDGAVFQNREGLLPPQPSGHYREYTVMPPAGSPSRITVGGRTFDIRPANGTRGVERLVIGGGRECWYSPDHYKTLIPLAVLR
jgi:ribonuclease T1